MSTAIGIDPSLTGTGLARVTADGVSGALLETSTVATSGRRADPLPDRHRRLEVISRSVTDWALPADLVVIEGPAYAARGGSVLDRHGLWWFLVSALLRRCVPVAVCPPSVRCRWATGRGNADKAAVSASVESLWRSAGEDPGGGLSGPQNANESDAAALASMAAQRLGLIPALTRHSDAASRVEWPLDQQLAHQLSIGDAIAREVSR
jgi:Holliday junction resolvasome RuvABC endonuclease subunit